MTDVKIILKKGRDVSLRRRHPWIFSGGIKRIEGKNTPGQLAKVYSAESELLGTGYLSNEGSIAVKMLTFLDEPIDEGFMCRRIQAALDIRLRLGLGNPELTDSYRLVNAEGDGLPGLIIDIYGPVAVVQCQSFGMNLQKKFIIEALSVVLGDKLEAVYDRSHRFSQDGDLPDTAGFLRGSSEQQIVRENGFRFFVDWKKGQKTGFFLDQRDNRKLVQAHVNGRRVLNAFCYTGGFSVYALAGGASFVESVDSSAPALELLQNNIELNFPGVSQKHAAVQDDFLRYMQNISEQFAVIVLDPPAFAKQRDAVPGALRGYRNINTHALRAIEPGGFLFTFSCSQMVSREDFRRTILEASLQANRSVSVVRELHQAGCHPVSIYHPEGDYLKGLMLSVR